jgi:spore maturation protein CgeB
MEIETKLCNIINAANYEDIYNNLSELDYKIDYYLKNEKERNDIAIAGYNRAKNYHTYHNRAKTLIQIINQQSI